MTEGKHQSPVRRPVIVTAFLFVAVAVMLVALRWRLDQPAEELGIEGDATIAAPQEASAPISATETGVELPVDTFSAEAGAAFLPPTVPATQPLKVALLPAHATGPDPAAAFMADAIRQVTLRALRGMANVEVVDVAPGELAAVVPASAAPERDDFLVLSEASREFGSDIAAVIGVRAMNNGLCWGVGLDLVRPDGSTSRGTRIRRNGDPGPGNDPETLGIRYAAVIAVDTRVRVAVPVALVAARNDLIDATKSDDERMRALITLGSARLDGESIAAAGELAASSTSPETRQRAWSVLRRFNYPALAQPMSIALQTDPDADVRREAALGLSRYLNEDGIRSALAQAAVGDGSLDVRATARMAMLDLDEQQDFMLETLLDRSLTPAERLAPMSVNPYAIVFRSTEDFGDELAEAVLAYADIIGGTDDPELKLSALSALQRTTLSPGLISGQRLEPDPALVSVLIETATDADERVQRAALLAARPFAAHPEIRAVLESVLAAKPRLATELNIAASLGLPLPQGSTSGAPPPPC